MPSVELTENGIFFVRSNQFLNINSRFGIEQSIDLLIQQTRLY